MRVKRFMSMLLTASVLTAAVPVISSAEDTTAAVVSGYVSTQSSDFILAGASKAPKLYVAATEAEPVKRAYEDFVSDIKQVTDKEATALDDAGIQIAYVDANIIEPPIIYTENGMILNAQNATSGTGIIASYDENGALLKMITSTTLEYNAFIFDEQVQKSESGSVRGYIWDGLNTMTPLKGAVDYIEYEPINHITVTTDADVIIGTIGKSDAIDTLITANAIDVSDVKDKFEAFTIQMAGDTLVIAGSDDRGTIYGMYDVSEKIGVSPWYWWSDVPVGHADNLYVDTEKLPYTEGEPSVKQRGIFINDESALQEFAKNTLKDTTWEETYKRVYELLLRLKANTLWPSMHTNSNSVYFHQYPVNAENAEKYGVSIGSSHCEMLLRNNEAEYADYEAAWEAAHTDKTLYKAVLPDSNNKKVAYMWLDKDPETGEDVDNKEFLIDYWTDSVHTYGKPTDLYTVGLRNLHDGTWDPSYCKVDGDAEATKRVRMELLLDVIKAQREILEKEFCTEESGLTIEDIPQVFIPYKEIQNYYDYYCEHKDEFTYQLPDDISVMWTDDNYGYVRQLPWNESERSRKGGAGIYYHISYHGSPNSYVWLTTTPLSLIREELTKAYDNNATGAWIINVGDIKPSDTQLGYIMHMARNMEENTDIRSYLEYQAKRDFGMNDEDAKEYADIEIEYNTLTMARKPEYTYKDETGSAKKLSQRHFTYNVYGDEGGAYTEKYEELVSRAAALNDKLSAAYQNPFYEVLLYSLRSSRNRSKWMTSAEKSTLYNTQGRGASINHYADESDAALAAIKSDTEYFNTKLMGGKWNRIMQPMQTSWFGVKRNARLDQDSVATARVTDYGNAEMGVYADDMSFTSYSSRPRYIDIFNTGDGSFDWTAATDADWITINKTEGTVWEDDRIWVTIDKTKLQSGTSTADITITSDTGTETVTVTAENESYDIGEKTYVEADGYVSIEAEHYTNAVSYDTMEWKNEKDFARSGDSMKLYPNIYRHTDNAGKTNSAYLEYDVYFKKAGTYSLDLYRMPTLNERGTLNVRVGVNDDTPAELVGNTSYYVNDSVGDDAWGMGVLTNNETLSTYITVAAGLNTIRVYGADTTFVFDKIVITTADTKPFSYFGAPESYNTTYNNTVTLPKPSVVTEPKKAVEWSFAEYADNTVTAEGETQVDYNGLKIHMNTGDTLTSTSLHWSVPGGTTSDRTTYVTNNRYIIYEPTENGTLNVTFKGSTVNGNNKPRMYICEGEDVTCTTKDRPDGNTAARTSADASGANSSKTVSLEVEVGKKYYIWAYLWKTSSAEFDITGVKFTPSAE